MKEVSKFSKQEQKPINKKDGKQAKAAHKKKNKSKPKTEKNLNQNHDDKKLTKVAPSDKSVNPEKNESDKSDKMDLKDLMERSMSALSANSHGYVKPVTDGEIVKKVLKDSKYINDGLKEGDDMINSFIQGQGMDLIK